MAKKKATKAALQWRVETAIHVDDLTSALEAMSGNGWDIVQVLGPAGRMTIIAKRLLVLR